MRIPWLFAVVVFAGTTTTARAETVGKIVDQARRLGDTLDTLVAIGYALENPDELQYLPAQIYGDLLAAIDEDPVISALFANLGEQYRHGYVRVAVDAGVTSDRATPIAATASVDAAWELPICRVLGASAYGMGGYDGDAIGAYALTGTACLPLPADTVQVSYTRRDNVRTSLLTRPVVLRDRQRDDIVDVMVRFYRYLGEHNVVDVMPFDLHVDVASSAATKRFGSQDLHLEVAPARWHRRNKGFLGSADQTFQFFEVRALFRNDADSTRQAANTIIMPLTIDGIRLGDDAAFGFELGVAQAGGSDGPNTMPVDVVRKTDVHARGMLDFVIRPVVAQLELSHTILPTYDAQLVVEDRVALHAQTALSRVLVRAEGFVTRARLLRQTGEIRAVLLGGASDVSLELADNLHLVGHVEGARVLDAVVATDPVTPRWELRATIGLTAHFDRRWPGR
ncbi:MAG: hypothetical protein NT062_10430 [Proteobacteria bacterium]|nr:hypothetical protein [Pseudomonadota bacterium]